ncbi:MAG: permease [Candidatus Thermoplasmatota archaeon]
MKISEKTNQTQNTKNTTPVHDHHPSSKTCVKEHEKIINNEKKLCPSCKKPSNKWYKERLYILTIILTTITIISYLIEPLRPFFNALKDYILIIWWAIILGFILGGFIDYFIPREYIEKYLSRHRKRSILYAVIFGFFMSACSHGILAIAIELYRKGANTSSVVAFLLASPWANLPITIILFGFFGLKALIIILSALLIAVITGLIYQMLERRNMVECCQCIRGEDTPILEDFSIIDDVKRRWKQSDFKRVTFIRAIKGVFKGSWALTKMVMWWLIIGILMAASIRALINIGIISHDQFILYMGPSLSGLVVTLIFATILEVCSEGSSPLAFEIYDQTQAFGNSLVFLMAGVSTDVTEIGLIWSNIGRKAAIWLPVITVPQVVIVGYICNLIL